MNALLSRRHCPRCAAETLWGTNGCAHHPEPRATRPLERPQRSAPIRPKYEAVKRNDLARLGARERQMLEHLASGIGFTRAMELMGLSRFAAHSYRMRMHDKLGIHLPPYSKETEVYRQALGWV